jgi:nickel-dependent lactate racemase
MEILLRYGTGSSTLTFPDRTHIPEINEPEMAVARELFIDELTQLLPRDKNKYHDVAIVVSDKTRLCGYPEYLPWLTGLLMEMGAANDRITFYIAYGTHARQTNEESYQSYGETYRQFRFIHHDCTDTSVFEICGTTSRGTSASFRKDILRCSLLITFGSVSHHYFAGFGGGRKLLFPGLGSKRAIYHNHSLFLDMKARSLASGCQPGNLDGNPLAEDLKEIDSFSPPKISIYGILNASGKVCRLMTGHDYSDFEKACQVHDSFYSYNNPDKYDLVVASGGGYPKDINFIQAHKAVHHAAAFVKDGGKLVVLLECIDQIGSGYFMKYLEAGSFEAAFDMLEKKYEGNGGTALSMMIKTKRIRIYMMTSLDHDICKTLNVTKIAAGDLQQLINNEKGSIAAIQNASMLVKQL